MQQLTRQGYFPNASFTTAHIRFHCVGSRLAACSYSVVPCHAAGRKIWLAWARLSSAFSLLACSSRSTVCSVPHLARALFTHIGTQTWRPAPLVKTNGR